VLAGGVTAGFGGSAAVPQFPIYGPGYGPVQRPPPPFYSNVYESPQVGFPSAPLYVPAPVVSSEPQTYEYVWDPSTQRRVQVPSQPKLYRYQNGGYSQLPRMEPLPPGEALFIARGGTFTPATQSAVDFHVAVVNSELVGAPLGFSSLFGVPIGDELQSDEEQDDYEEDYQDSDSFAGDDDDLVFDTPEPLEMDDVPDSFSLAPSSEDAVRLVEHTLTAVYGSDERLGGLAQHVGEDFAQFVQCSLESPSTEAAVELPRLFENMLARFAFFLLQMAIGDVENGM